MFTVDAGGSRALQNVMWLQGWLMLHLMNVRHIQKQNKDCAIWPNLTILKQDRNPTGKSSILNPFRKSGYILDVRTTSRIQQIKREKSIVGKIYTTFKTCDACYWGHQSCLQLGFLGQKHLVPQHHLMHQLLQPLLAAAAAVGVNPPPADRPWGKPSEKDLPGCTVHCATL